MRKPFLTLPEIALGFLTTHLLAQPPTNWPPYGGGPTQTRYSNLTQINKSNVQKLQIAWTYDTSDGPGDPQTQPIMVDGVLFGLTPRHKVIALDAATGKLLWQFDSGIVGRGANRSVVYWSSGDDRRIFAAVQSFIYALDARTGKVISNFGKDGRIDLRENLGRDPAKQSIVETSPGIIYKDLLIVGDRTPEALPAPPGDIRAYDVRTGTLRWTFHTIPHPGEPGYETWPKDGWTYTGAANNWASATVDRERGLIFLPVGQPAAQYYGGARPGQNLYSSSIVALDANSGKVRWYFQITHHDLWDYDAEAAPSLMDVTRDGKKIPVVVAISKPGLMFFLDRETGKSVYPVEERPVPQSDVPGEQSSPTHPFPVNPPPLARQGMKPDEIFTGEPEHEKFCRDLAAQI